MTWEPTRIPHPVPMSLRDPVTPGSAIPMEIAWTMRTTPRDEMTTGEAEAYRRGYARGFEEAVAWLLRRPKTASAGAAEAAAGPGRCEGSADARTGLSGQQRGSGEGVG